MELIKRKISLVAIGVDAKKSIRQVQIKNSRKGTRNVLGFLMAICAINLGTFGNNARAETVKSKEVVTSYSYERDEKEIGQLIKGVERLNLGDTLNQVKTILGEPTEEKDLVDKKGKFHSKLLAYYISRVDTRLVNIHDRYIGLHFNSEGKLINIQQNINANMLPEKAITRDKRATNP